MTLDGSWGYASDKTYQQRWELIAPQLRSDAFTMIDWGSDSGWFSVKTALDFPESKVIAVDGSIMLGDSNVREHKSRVSEMGITNNHLVNCLFDADTFAALKSCPVNYQLVLSVFHWMGDGIGTRLQSRDDWNAAFIHLIEGAEYTFFEVPNEDDPGETPHKIRSWYDGRPVAEVIRSAIEGSGVRAEYRELGEIEHPGKGYRKLFLIQSAAQAIAPERVLEVADVIARVGSRIRLPFSMTARTKLRGLINHLRAFRS